MSLVLDSSATLAWIYGDEITEPIRRVFDLVGGSWHLCDRDVRPR